MCVRLVVAVLLGLSALVGCARHETRISTYLSSDLPFPPPRQGVRIAVAADSDIPETLLKSEVKRKVEHLLRQRGYESGTRGTADYVLSAKFSMDSGKTVTRRVENYVPGYTTTCVYGRRGGRKYHRVRRHYPGRWERHSYQFTYYTRFLDLTLYACNARGATSAGEQTPRLGVGRRADTVVWRATAASTGESSDLRRTIDYLLVATFEHFGDDTGMQVREVLSEDDDRVQALREATRARPL